MDRVSVAGRLDDLINPIAVKELRQAVKGRFVAWTLLVFLLVQLLIIGAVLVLNDRIGQSFNIGREVFAGLQTVLLVTCIFFLPAFTAVRFASERSETNVDLLFITTLRPVQIIWGKTIAAMILVCLFFSAALPFMTVTFLLRGLDIPSTLLTMGYNFLLVISCIQLSILIGALPGSILARGLFFLIGLGSLMTVFTFGMQSALMVTLGVASTLASWNFWGPAVTVAILLLAGAGLMMVLSVMLVAPSSANKALGIRVYLLLIWALTAALAAGWAVKIGNPEVLQAWLVPMVLLFSAGMFFAICERHRVGPRVRKRIPKNVILRALAFLFYSGAAGGVCYSIMMLAATLATYRLAVSAFTNAHLSDLAVRFSVTLALYAVSYLLSALVIRRLFFRNRENPYYPALIAFVLVALGSVIPMVAGFLIHSKTWHHISPLWYIGNPLAVLWDRELHVWPECLRFSLAWAVIMVAATIPWIARQFRAFNPLMPTIPDCGEPCDG